MRISTILSVVFVAASVGPVMSAPVWGVTSVTEPDGTVVTTLNNGQTITLTPAQMEQLSHLKRSNLEESNAHGLFLPTVMSTHFSGEGPEVVHEPERRDLTDDPNVIKGLQEFAASIPPGTKFNLPPSMRSNSQYVTQSRVNALSPSDI